MSLFGGSSSGEPWPLDVLTLDYLFSGQVEPADQKWGWTYFSMTEKRAPEELRLTVSGARSTSGLAAPTWTGGSAGFSYETAMIALIARGDASVKVWEQWSASIGEPVAAQFLIGPYVLTGSALSVDGRLSMLINDRFAVRDATIVRADGRGDGAPIDVPFGVVARSLVQAAVLGAPA